MCRTPLKGQEIPSGNLTRCFALPPSPLAPLACGNDARVGAVTTTRLIIRGSRRCSPQFPGMTATLEHEHGRESLSSMEKGKTHLVEATVLDDSQIKEVRVQLAISDA
jgi:hypothetical protein